jgi:TPR repeat protein
VIIINRTILKQLAVIIWLLSGAMPLCLHAQDFEDGKAAYEAKDYKKALEILLPLAEQGNSQAQVTLGIMYDYGQGVEKDPAEAMKWYVKAAEQGIPVVQHDVGVKYFQGSGVKQDYLEAAKWWEMSANAGLADSQFNLGLLYYRGLGVETDYQKAAELFRKASEQDHPHAQYSLAVMNAFGQGMEKDYEEALKWFRESAEHGVPQAQFNLGVFYENGYGLPKNMDTAKQWYAKAAKQGLEEAKQKMEELSQRITHPETASLPETAVTAPAETPATTTVPVSEPEPESAPAPAPAPPAVATPARVTDSGIRREDWVLLQKPDSYTLQLSSLLSENDALKFIRSNRLETEAAYIQVVVNNTTRYTVIHGVYSTHAEAEQAIKRLPANLQKDKPWVRNFGVLQKLLQ